MQNTFTYKLTPERFEEALAIIDSELEVLRPFVPVQRRALPRVAVSLFSFSIALPAIAIASRRGWIAEGTEAWTVPALFAVYLLVTLVLSLGEWRALLRLRKTEQRLGLNVTGTFGTWPEIWRSRWLLLPGLSGILTFLGLLVATNPATTPAWVPDLAFGVLCIGIAVTGMLLLISNTKWPQLRIEAGEQLRSTLLAKRSAASSENETFITIPEETYKQIARIERALVNKQRQQVIKRIVRKVDRPFRALQQNIVVTQKKLELDPSVRLRVQSRIEDLALDPHPPEAIMVTSGNWLLPVPDTSFHISYALTDSEHVMIQDLIEA